MKASILFTAILFPIGVFLLALGYLQAAPIASPQPLPEVPCAKPSPAHTEHCRNLEEQILATTVRLEIADFAPQADGSYKFADVSVGHATVMAGRYLVTHNHFSLSLENLNDGHLRKLSAYRLDGTVLIHDAPFHVFDVLIAEPQTLVFDFGEYDRQGALAYYGMASAEFGQWQTMGLQPGDEVAQVNWDGRVTSVDWVRVSAIGEKNGTPVLELDNFVEPGASGGGIFYEGHHLGNNWIRTTDKEATSGQIVRQFTLAALNTGDLFALSQSSSARDSTDAGPVNLTAQPATDTGPPDFLVR